MGVLGIDKMLQLMSANTLLYVNINSCTEKSNGRTENLGEVIFRFASQGRPDIALQEMNMGRNENVEIEDVCNALYHMSNLKKLDLSYCDGVTFDFIVKIFEELWTQSSNCEAVRILSYSNIWTKDNIEHESLQRLLSNIKYLASENSLKQLELAFQKGDVDQCEVMKEIVLEWYNVFKGNSKIEISSQKILLSVHKKDD